MSDDVLSLQGVIKRFGGVTAVDGLDLRVPRGTVFGLMGPNGAGKTTVLNIITGFFAPDEGHIAFDGTNITGTPSHQSARLGITRTYQNVRLFTGMTVREQVIAGMYAGRSSAGWQAVLGLGSERRERRESRERAEELLQMVGGDLNPNALAENLSYGDQRRVEIARAMAANPKLLLLDEPTAGMNVSEAASIGRLMRALNEQGVTIVVIEHNIKLIVDYCDLAFVLSFGQQIAAGTPVECVKDEQVQAAYFGRRNDAERLRALRELRVDPSG